MIEFYDRPSSVDGSHPRFMWYEKPTIMDQKFFHLPTLGWVTVFQFGLLVGLGAPLAFAAMSVFGVFAAPWPLIAAFIFAKFRPPLLGYEMRLYHIIRFRMFGPKKKRIGPKPKKYSIPRISRKAAAEAKPESDEPLEMVAIDRPRDLHMGLPAGTPMDKRLVVKLDGVLAGTPYPASDGTVPLRLYPEDMRGERVVAVLDDADNQVAGRVLVFVQAAA